MVPIVTFVGRSGSGKTTFVERLIGILAQRGIRVCAAKHSHHEPDWNDHAKDSQRYRDCGSVKAIFHSPSQVALFDNQGGDHSLESLASDYCGDCDIMIAEGYKSADISKIEISRAAHNPELLFGESEHLVALVADHDPGIEIPVFGLDDFTGVAEFIIHRFLSGNRPK